MRSCLLSECIFTAPFLRLNLSHENPQSSLDLFGKCNSHLEKASFVYDAVGTPRSKWRGGGGEAEQKSALPFSQRVFSEEVY